MRALLVVVLFMCGAAAAVQVKVSAACSRTYCGCILYYQVAYSVYFSLCVLFFTPSALWSCTASCWAKGSVFSKNQSDLVGKRLVKMPFTFSDLHFSNYSVNSSHLLKK